MTTQHPTFWSHVITLLMPFTMVVLVPLWVLWGNAYIGSLWLAVIGVVVFVAALSLFIATEYLFIQVGKGTLAPWNQTIKLVAVGPYRYCRNPMISGVLGMILGEAAFFASWQLLGWAAIFFAVNTVYFIFSEEPGLEKRFGDSYQTYKQHVPRWIPRAKPYSQE